VQITVIFLGQAQYTLNPLKEMLSGFLVAVMTPNAAWKDTLRGFVAQMKWTLHQ
jgi:hypothetical protein